MTEIRKRLSEGYDDLMRQIVQQTFWRLASAQQYHLCDAGRGEKSDERINSYRAEPWGTRV